MKLRTVLLLLSCLALLSWGVASLAQCASNPPANVYNKNAGYQTIAYTTAGSDLLGKFWIDAASTANNSGATTQAVMLTGSGQASGLVYPYCTWAAGTFSGAHPSGWDVIGGVTCDRTVFLYSNYNGGAPQFLVMSVKGRSNGNFDFDQMTNGGAPGNILAPIAVPQVTSASRAVVAGGNDYTIHWTAVANPKGYYDTDPGHNILTGIAVYFWNAGGTPSGTANYAITNANWVLAAGGPSVRTGYVTFAGADPGTAIVFLPTAAPNPTFVALELLFDGQGPSVAAGFYPRVDFVGPAISVAAPTPAGLFVQNNAAERTGQVTVSWRTNVESAVASYQVFYAGKKNGNYKPIEATMTAPMGNNSAYSVTFARPTQAAKFFVKVKATMTSGTDQWSDTMKVGQNASKAELDD